MTGVRTDRSRIHAEERQRRLALEKADRVRSRRGRIKRLIAEGRITLADVFAADKQHLDTMKVRDLLRAVPGMGEARIKLALRSNRIGELAELQDVSFRRRAELVVWIEQRYPRAVVRSPWRSPGCARNVMRMIIAAPNRIG